VLGVVFNATDVLISLTVISVAEDVTTGIMWRKLPAKIAVGVLIHFLISITVAIAVVISTTMTISVSIVTVAIVITTAAITTASRVDLGWTMLAT
jgi:hypothetical protein